MPKPNSTGRLSFGRPTGALNRAHESRSGSRTGRLPLIQSSPKSAPGGIRAEAATEPCPVEIAAVRRLCASGTQVEIEVALGVRIATTTAFRNWSLGFKASYEDGASSQVVEGFSTPLPDKLVLRLPRQSPRDGRSRLVGYEARLEVDFQTVAVRSQTREFAANAPPREIRPQIVAPSGGEPWVEILEARREASNVSQQEPVEVTWSAVAQRGVVIHRFDLEIETDYQDGAAHRARRSVFGHHRRAKFWLPLAGAAMTTIKVGVKTTYSCEGSVVASRQGRFSS